MWGTEMEVIIFCVKDVITTLLQDEKETEFFDDFWIRNNGAGRRPKLFVLGIRIIRTCLSQGRFGSDYLALPPYNRVDTISRRVKIKGAEGGFSIYLDIWPFRMVDDYYVSEMSCFSFMPSSNPLVNTLIIWFVSIEYLSARYWRSP